MPFAAGGPTDTVTRLVAEPMAAELGVEIVVQNVEGAGGTVAADQVANAEPDGYTVLMHHIGMSTAPTLYPDLTYDPLEDFEMIGLVTEVPMTFIGSPDFEPTTMEELIAYVEDNLDTVTYANAGVGAASQLCGLLFETATGLDLTEVPYDGTGPAMDDLLGNQVDFMCDQTTNTAERILGDEVKAYAVTTPERIEALPDVPTTEEAGLADLQVTVWHGLYVPAGTPQEAIDALNAALKVALADEGVITRMGELGHRAGSGGSRDAGGASGAARIADRAVATHHRGSRRGGQLGATQWGWGGGFAAPSVYIAEEEAGAAGPSRAQGPPGRGRVHRARVGICRRLAGIRHRHPRAHGSRLRPARARRWCWPAWGSSSSSRASSPARVSRSARSTGARWS